MRRRGYVAAILLTAAAVLVAVVVAFPDNDAAASPPISIRDEEVGAECLGGTFVPGVSGWTLGEKAPPAHWRRIEAAHGAVQADRGAVEVTIRPREGNREVTLTGVKFRTAYYGRPEGGDVFYRPCERRVRGPALEFDLDPNPPRLLASNADSVLEGPLKVKEGGRRIRFPWTIPLRRPVHLYLVVNADDSYCVWSARILWREGSSSGALAVDNGGRGFRIVDTTGVGWLKPNGSSWAPTSNFAEGS